MLGLIIRIVLIISVIIEVQNIRKLQREIEELKTRIQEIERSRE